MMTPERLKEIDVLLRSAEASWGLSLSYPSWDDIAQICRSHLCVKIGKFDPERGKFSTWAKRVIRNQLVNLKKKYYLRYVPPHCSCPDNFCWKSENGDCLNREDWNINKKNAASIHFASSIDETFEDEDNARIQVEGDIVDLKQAAERLHEIMTNKLTGKLREFYILKFVEERSDEYIAEFFGYISNEPGRAAGYRQTYLNLQEIRELAKLVVATHDIF